MKRTQPTHLKQLESLFKEELGKIPAESILDPTILPNLPRIPSKGEPANLFAKNAKLLRDRSVNRDIPHASKKLLNHCVEQVRVAARFDMKQETETIRDRKKRALNKAKRTYDTTVKAATQKHQDAVQAAQANEDYQLGQLEERATQHEQYITRLMSQRMEDWKEEAEKKVDLTVQHYIANQKIVAPSHKSVFESQFVLEDYGLPDVYKPSLDLFASEKWDWYGEQKPVS
eukprot:TRINITY_DN57071_c0_g1_i1.p1 TRINITY_DN57071_c0_g1~~TRINITY_DN57071_c0_g1_i1.p1  ORF type:complete len:230 (-),score=10.63 TRINITY_DN57071_c0_g1_i1:104-793(-)